MKKLLLIGLLLTACEKKEAKYAEIMVHAQVPDANCSSVMIKNISVASCKLPSGEEVMAFYGGGYPFQFYTLKKPAQPEPPKPVPVDAGVTDAK